MTSVHNASQFYAPKPKPATHLYAPLGGEHEHTFDPPSRDPSHVDMKEGLLDDDYRKITRTPSPTPSEVEALSGKTRTCNIAKLLDPTYFKNPRNILTFVITSIIIGGLIAFSVLQDQIVVAMRPFSNWMLRTPGGWLIPIGIMIILSFPPLFGHELVAALCGDVYGLGIGFGIVAAGTIIGELVTYYTFRYCCATRAKKVEDKNLRYALLTEVIREGGFKIALIARYSAIPGHVTTAMFASCGISVVTFLLAAILALPKQLASVYFGVSQNNGTDNATKTRNTIIKVVVIIITTVMTMVAMRYINAQIDLIKKRFIYERRKARQAKLEGIVPSSSINVDLEDTIPLVAHGRSGSVMDVERDTESHIPPSSRTRTRYAAPSYPPPGLSAAGSARYEDPYDGRDAFAVGGLRPPQA